MKQKPIPGAFLFLVLLFSTWPCFGADLLTLLSPNRPEDLEGQKYQAAVMARLKVLDLIQRYPTKQIDLSMLSASQKEALELLYGASIADKEGKITSKKMLEDIENDRLLRSPLNESRRDGILAALARNYPTASPELDSQILDVYTGYLGESKAQELRNRAREYLDPHLNNSPRSRTRDSSKSHSFLKPEPFPIIPVRPSGAHRR